MKKSRSMYYSIIHEGQFQSEVLDSAKPAVVFFHSEDCIPCSVFTPIFERVTEDFYEKIAFFRIDRPSNRTLSEKYNIQSTPTLMFFQKSVEICSRLSGYIEVNDLLASMDMILGKTCLEHPVNQVTTDILILGAGPAGLTAAIYASRSRLLTTVIDTSITGGQVGNTFQIANYPGVNGVVRGSDLMDNMKKQAVSFGSEIYDMQKIHSTSIEGTEKTVITDTHIFKAKAIIIANGAEPRKLPISMEKEYRSRGIHYCATCDGALYQDSNVLVVGGGVSALEEAEFMTRYAKKVTIINRSDSFRAPEGITRHVLSLPSISVIYHSIVTSVSGEVFVERVTIHNSNDHTDSEMQTDAIFVYIGSQPDTSLFGNSLKLAEGGFIEAGEDMKTNIPGVFVAGDIRNKPIRQITTAVSDGTIAAIMAERFLNS